MCDKFRVKRRSVKKKKTVPLVMFLEVSFKGTLYTQVSQFYNDVAV